MYGFKFRLEGLYFTTFRKPTSTSLLLSYSIPPFTTIRGLIANAVGLRRDDYSVQDWVKIGIRPIKTAEKSTEMAKILKLKGTDGKHKRVFPSSPVFRDFLIMPIYDIYLVGASEGIVTIHNALENPTRPLYGGGSDELVDIGTSAVLEIQSVNSKDINSIVEGIYPNCLVENVPYKFTQEGKKFSLVLKTVSIPQDSTVRTDNPLPAYRFGKEIVWVG